jgi:hypothetical protein
MFLFPKPDASGVIYFHKKYKGKYCGGQIITNKVEQTHGTCDKCGETGVIYPYPRSSSEGIFLATLMR